MHQTTDSDGAPDDTRRSLPACLFGPDMSLRHVPQFPGGRKIALPKPMVAYTVCVRWMLHVDYGGALLHLQYGALLHLQYGAFLRLQ